MPTVTIVSGSPVITSRLAGLTQYVESKLNERNIPFHSFHVVDIPAEDLIFGRFDSEAVVRAQRLVAEADAVVFASPVYKASYTGVLKTFLDLIPQKGLADKVVLPLFIGGTIAHLLAIDYAFKPVIAVLGAHHILGGVFAIDSWVTRTDGGFELADELKRRLDDAVADLVTAIA